MQSVVSSNRENLYAEPSRADADLGPRLMEFLEKSSSLEQLLLVSRVKTPAVLVIDEDVSALSLADSADRSDKNDHIEALTGPLARCVMESEGRKKRASTQIGVYGLFKNGLVDRKKCS